MSYQSPTAVTDRLPRVRTNTRRRRPTKARLISMYLLVLLAAGGIAWLITLQAPSHPRPLSNYTSQAVQACRVASNHAHCMRLTEHSGSQTDFHDSVVGTYAAAVITGVLLVVGGVAIVRHYALRR